MHSQRKRNKYLKLRRDGVDSRVASKECKIGYSTGNAWERWWQQSGSVLSPGRAGGGSVSEIAERIDEVMDYLKLNRWATYKQIAKHMKSKGLVRDQTSYLRQFQKLNVKKVDGEWKLPGEKSASGAQTGKERRNSKLAREDERIIEMARLGATLGAIVNYLGKKRGITCTEPAVAYRLQLHGVSLRNSRGGGNQVLQSPPAAEVPPEELPESATDCVQPAPIHRVKESMLTPYQQDILNWHQSDPEQTSLAQIVRKLKSKHGIKTSETTVGKFLKAHGIQLKPGRKRKRDETLAVFSNDATHPRMQKNDATVTVSNFRKEFADENYYDMAFKIRHLAKLFDQFSISMGLTDPRLRSPRHKLKNILPLTMLAVGAGKNSIHKMHFYLQEHQTVLSELFGLSHGVPAESTIWRVLLELNTSLLSRVVFKITSRPGTSYNDMLVFSNDGQTLRRASKLDELTGLLTAFAQGSKQSVAAIPYGRTGAEQTVFRDLLKIISDDLGMDNVVFTADALHSNTKTLAMICKLGGHFCMPLKDNNPNLKQAIIQFVHANKKNHDQYWETKEKSRDRYETRTYSSYTPSPELIEAWKHAFRNEEYIPELKQIIVERNYRNKSVSERIIILSKNIDIETGSKIIRNHWGVEVNVHFVADTRFGQDFIKAYSGNIPLNLAVLIRGYMNLVEQFMPELSTTKKYNLAEVSLNKNLQIIASAVNEISI